MLPVILTISGAVLMLAGVVMLTAWVSGQTPRRPAFFDRRGPSKPDRQLIDLYYIVTVLGPLLCGAVMLAFGLRRWL